MGYPTHDGGSMSSLRGRTAVGRAYARFVTDPASTRNAIVLIVVANLTIVVIGGLIVWLLDRREYEHLTEAFWYTLQTITTVGYGDVTPTDVSGRLVGAVVMLLGIASLSMLTATITSSFVEARQAGRLADAAAEDRATRASLEARLEEVIERLDRMEQRASRDAD